MRTAYAGPLLAGMAHGAHATYIGNGISQRRVGEVQALLGQADPVLFPSENRQEST
jgi:hypothetical protein